MWINLVLQIFLVDVHRANYYLHLPVCEVEVELPVERHPESGQTEDEEIPGTAGRLLVGHEGDPVGGAAVDIERLPECELEDSQQGVPHVVQHLTEQSRSHRETGIISNDLVYGSYDIH